MKKWLCMVLCIGMMFGAVGCGDAEQTTEPEEKQEEQAKKEDTRGIAGSHYYDMCNAMMKNGFPQFETSYLADEDINIVVNSQLQDVYTYTYGLSYVNSGEIVDGSFSIANTDMLDNDTFLEEAKVFLNFCATMPYDTMDAEKLQNWIAENITTVGSGEDGAEIVIGDAKFTLYGAEVNGTQTGRTMYVEKAA